MKSLNQYINEGFKDSFVNLVKNLFCYKKDSIKNLVKIENIDPKAFGSLVRDKQYFSPTTNEYPKLIPLTSPYDDLWELYQCEKGEDKYGNKESIFTYIGEADFRKDKNVILVDKNYQELVENVINKYK